MCCLLLLDSISSCLDTTHVRSDSGDAATQPLPSAPLLALSVSPRRHSSIRHGNSRRISVLFLSDNLQPKRSVSACAPLTLALRLQRGLWGAIARSRPVTAASRNSRTDTDVLVYTGKLGQIEHALAACTAGQYAFGHRLRQASELTPVRASSLHLVPEHVLQALHRSASRVGASRARTPNACMAGS